MFVRLKSEGEELAAIFSASLPKTREKDSRRITIRTVFRSPGIGFFHPGTLLNRSCNEVKPIKRDTFHGLARYSPLAARRASSRVRCRSLIRPLPVNPERNTGGSESGAFSPSADSVAGIWWTFSWQRNRTKTYFLCRHICFFPLKLLGIVAEIPSDSATSSRGRFLLFLC